jgi:hypothetical protein
VSEAKNLIKNDADQAKQAVWVDNSAIKEELCSSLLSIASKLLSSEHLRLQHLSQAEQHLWNSFKNRHLNF